MESIKKEMVDYKRGDEECWMERNAVFLTSQEYYNLLGIRADKMLKYGFERVGRQFLQSGIIPRGANLSFPNPLKVWDDLPPSKKLE